MPYNAGSYRSGIFEVKPSSRGLFQTNQWLIPQHTRLLLIPIEHPMH